MTNATRKTSLRLMLTERRRETSSKIQRRLRDGRTEHQRDVHDGIDDSDADVQSDIELALQQMRSEMVVRIDEALIRLDADQYGKCFECAKAIAEQRLRALPFAVRCHTCEASREQGQGTTRRLAQQRSGLSLFPEMATS